MHTIISTVYYFKDSNFVDLSFLPQMVNQMARLPANACPVLFYADFGVYTYVAIANYSHT